MRDEYGSFPFEFVEACHNSDIDGKAYKIFLIILFLIFPHVAPLLVDLLLKVLHSLFELCFRVLAGELHPEAAEPASNRRKESF